MLLVKLSKTFFPTRLITILNSVQSVRESLCAQKLFMRRFLRCTDRTNVRMS